MGCKFFDVSYVADKNVTSLNIEFLPKYSTLNIKYLDENIIADRTIKVG